MDEARHYHFLGLPSNPFFIYYTAPLCPPAFLKKGPGVRCMPKVLRPVCIHPISSVWPELGEKIYKYFDSIDLRWTSIDPVRFSEVGQEAGPLFLWVGVLPDTLSSDLAKEVAVCCKEILSTKGIFDVEIAFRESIYTRYSGSKLLDHVSSVDPTVDLRVPFTPALGLSIAPEGYPYLGGTACLYLLEGGASDRVFLLTSRHVALPPDHYDNEHYHRKNDRVRCIWVVHHSSGPFDSAFSTFFDKIAYWDFAVDSFKEEIANMEQCVKGEKPKFDSDLQALQHKLKEAQASKSSVEGLRSHVFRHWISPEKRIMGHVIYAPPISPGTGDSFTQDWALIELYRKKFNWESFQGNVIYLGPRLTAFQLMKKMYPHVNTRPDFKYPPGGLMQLRAFVKYDELRDPKWLDVNGEECLIVLKSGAATGLTIGRATCIESFVREYKDNAIHSTSMEIAVYPYSNEDGPFSAPGDSGSAVCDVNSRVVGMLTGGAGLNGLPDVTYVTPYYTLDQHIRTAFPHSHFFPNRDLTSA